MKNASMTTAIAPGQNQGPLMSFFKAIRALLRSD